MHPMIKEILISENEIVEKCKELGQKIDQEYQSSQPPLLVALLKGSVPFLSELIKHIKMDVEFDFMDVSSYEGTESIGDIRINKDLDRSIKGVDILLVEDIVDTGRTLKNVKEMLFNKGAASVRVVALLDKPSRRVVEDIHAEYIGFEIPDAFVVGFGLDYNQKYRNLPYIGVLKDECYK
ncbi:MAG: hypoxanthine phosphoribosyltransferase [Erysipelotrichaceae bacterium]|nr:hypoxanthine phosphoribosyltransferase [Erysipelotrichaceae bacterium]